MKPFDFGPDEIRGLLAELDRRLAQRKIAAAIYVVGGAAMAVSVDQVARRTVDIDVAVQNLEVLAEARAMAVEHALTPNWLNNQVEMWMPPLPRGALDAPRTPGLRITYAVDRDLFAMKVVAQRRRDTVDLIALAARLELVHPSAEDLARIVRDVYTDAGQLEMIAGPDENELVRLCERVASMLRKRS